MITVRAHAKINLSLRVLGIRPDDGYHDLLTVFQSLELHDTLHFVQRPGPFEIQSDDPRLPVDQTNLVWRAGALLWQHLGRSGSPADVLIQIEKRIPMKGGLGGGSADAAAVLMTLAGMWLDWGGASKDPLFLPAKDLLALGRRLGADVPFFLIGGAALGEGRGDRLQPLPDLPALAVLLVVPDFDVSTPAAYRWVDEARGWGGPSPEVRESESPRVRESTICEDEESRRSDFRTLLLSDFRTGKIPRCPWPSPLDEVINDFEPVVAARHPQVDAIVSALHEAGAAAAAMTGSGSTIFGLFEGANPPNEAVERMSAFGKVLTTRTLGRAAYLELSAPHE